VAGATEIFPMLLNPWQTLQSQRFRISTPNFPHAHMNVILAGLFEA